jgi:hypothetical protein
VTLRPYSKIDQIVFFTLINIHTIHHNDKAKTGFYTFLLIFLKIKTEISHSQKYSDPLLSTLLKNLWQQLQTRVVLGMILQAFHTCIGEFLPFFSADPLKLCQIEWGASLHSYFQISPETLDWVQVQALAGPLKSTLPPQGSLG